MSENPFDKQWRECLVAHLTRQTQEGVNLESTRKALALAGFAPEDVQKIEAQAKVRQPTPGELVQLELFKNI